MNTLAQAAPSPMGMERDDGAPRAPLAISPPVELKAATITILDASCCSCYQDQNLKCCGPLGCCGNGCGKCAGYWCGCASTFALCLSCRCGQVKCKTITCGCCDETACCCELILKSLVCEMCEASACSGCKSCCSGMPFRCLACLPGAGSAPPGCCPCCVKPEMKLGCCGKCFKSCKESCTQTLKSCCLGICTCGCCGKSEGRYCQKGNCLCICRTGSSCCCCCCKKWTKKPYEENEQKVNHVFEENERGALVAQKMDRA